MKKLFLYTLISLAVSLSANSDELSSINKLIENGYKIISEDIITRQDSKSFIKTFTLQNKKSSLIICNVSFDSGGYLDDFSCLKPCKNYLSIHLSGFDVVQCWVCSL